MKSVWFHPTNCGCAFKGSLCAWVKYSLYVCVRNLLNFSLVNVAFESTSMKKRSQRMHFGMICEVSSLERAINDVLCCYKIPLCLGSLFHPWTLISSLRFFSLFHNCLHHARSSLTFRAHWKIMIIGVFCAETYKFKSFKIRFVCWTPWFVLKVLNFNEAVNAK